jgi:hypothetical protein
MSTYVVSLRSKRWTAAVTVGFVLSMQGFSAAAIDRDQQLAFFMQAAAATLAAEQQQTLALIPDQDRRHLAMTYYLRAGASIGSRWSWTKAQIDVYRQSSEYSETMSEIEKIAARFAEQNPNYRLFVNTEVRSLEEQIERWGTVRSIAAAANQLRRAAVAQLAGPNYEATPDEKSLKAFLKFLEKWRASPPPTLAAPGMSLHGRGRAYDFQVRDLQNRMIAGTDSSTVRTVWDANGWTDKLSRAVHGASKRFVGPLEAPREPWHYQYRPDQ